MDIKNKVVLLTGASTGIGKAIAKEFLKKQARVIVFGRNKPEFCSEFYEVNVGDEEQIISALSKVNNIDILINNSGISRDSRVKDISTEALNDMIDINFKGVFWMCKHSINKINDSGCIINMSSICGLKGYKEMAIYSATKAAVRSLTQTLALELAKRKIRANAIAPGVIETGIWKKRFGSESEKVLKEIEAAIPLKRGGTTKEIAHVAIFLCENDFINGETVVADGAQTIVG